MGVDPVSKSKALWSQSLITNSSGTGRLLRTIAATILAVAVPLTLSMILVAPQFTRRWVVLSIAFAALGGGMLALLALGRNRAAGWFLTIAGWGALTSIVWTAGGVSAPSICGQLLVVAFAGLVLGERASFFALALSVATVAALVYAEVTGIITPGAVVHTPLSRGLVVVSYLVVLLLMQRVVLRAFGWNRARTVRELAQRTESEERLRSVIENAPFGAIAFRVDGDGHLVITNANLSAALTLGLASDSLLGTSLESVLPAISSKTHLYEIRQIALSGGTCHLKDITYEHATGPIQLDLRFYQADAGEGAVFFSDVTEQRRTENKILHMAFHDGLTSLPNRELLADRLKVAMANAHRTRTHVGLLFLDLDDFKPINDRFGHTVGDALLVAVAQRLKRSARAGDTVARIGGDEFTILLPSVRSVSEIEIVASKVVQLLHEPFEIDEHSIRVTASVGVAMSDGRRVEPDALLSQADAAMYRMKNSGRDGYKLATELEIGVASVAHEPHGPGRAAGS